jgi:hypothetical protein
MNDELSAIKPDPEVIAVLAHLMETVKISDGRMIGVLPSNMQDVEKPLFKRTIRALSDLGGKVNEGMPVVIFPPDVDLNHIVYQLLEHGEACPNGGKLIEEHTMDDLQPARMSALT